MIRATLMTAAAALAMTGSAQAASVLIDSFDDPSFQAVGAPLDGVNGQTNPVTNSVGSTTAIGGNRTITNERTVPSLGTPAAGRSVTTVVSGGVASVSLGASTEGSSLFSWSAGGVDLTDGGTNDSITIDVINSDLNVTYTVAVDGAAVSRSVTGAGTLVFNFADFTTTNFASVSDISLLITGGASFDTEFDIIQAVANVPLPAGGLLALAGLGALGATRARRKA